MSLKLNFVEFKFCYCLPIALQNISHLVSHAKVHYRTLLLRSAIMFVTENASEEQFSASSQQRLQSLLDGLLLKFGDAHVSCD